MWLFSQTANCLNKMNTLEIIGLDLILLKFLLTFDVISVSGLEFEDRRSER